MTPQELGKILSDMYQAAPNGEKSTMVHLFGIRYADAIQHCGVSVEEIIDLSVLGRSYNTEVRKGMRLARYVVPRA